MDSELYFNAIDNYIYIHHTNTLVVIPTFPEQINDNTSTTYTPTSILGRSAPIYTYSGSGPRSVDISLKLHRDMMNAVNTDVVPPTDLAENDPLIQDYVDLENKLKRKDYMDLLINELQAIALPSYVVAEKMINPPIVTLRIGDEIFCKGIIDGGVSVAYSGPILANPIYDEKGDFTYIQDAEGNDTYKRAIGKGKYALVDIQFKVTEIDPYDAQIVRQQGGMRGLNRTLERNLYKVSI
jgi:hypothetical protein